MGSLHHSDGIWRDCLFFVVAATIAFRFVLGANGHTPLMWHDDLIWEYGGEYWYVQKLRGEGRWLIYYWYRIFDVRSGAFDLLIFSAGWASTAFMIGRYIFRGTRARTSAASFAALLFSSPMFFSMMTAPHSAAPIMVISAICAVLIYHTCDGKFAIGAWVAALTILMLTYQPMALTFACVGVLRVIAAEVQIRNVDEEAGICTPPLEFMRELVLAAALIASALVIGFLVQRTMQFLNFGIWELEIAEWRRRTATADLTLISFFALVRYSISIHVSAMRFWLSDLPALAGSVWIIAALVGIYQQRSLFTPKRVLVFAFVAIVLASMFLATYAILFLETVVLPFQAMLPSWLVLSFIGGLSLLTIQNLLIRRCVYVSLIAFVAGIAIKADVHASRLFEERQALESIVTVYATQVLEAIERHELDQPVVIGYGTPADLPDTMKREGAFWLGAYLQRRLRGKVSAVRICSRQEICNYISNEAASVIGQSALKRKLEGERPRRVFVVGDEIILDFDAHLFASGAHSF